MLLRIAVRDPRHLPENLAGFSLRMLSPAVPAYVAELRRQNPEANARELERLIARQGLRETSREGGFVGGPFMVLVPVAFITALLAQIKMLLRMAAVTGHDPREPQRAAEILVILGVHRTLDQAVAALRATPPVDSGTRAERSVVFAMADLIRRMAKLLGLVTPAAVTAVSWLVHLGRWLLLGLALLVGTVAPLIWLPYLSMSYYRGTIELAERVSLFYSGPEGALHLPRRTVDVPGLAAALLRAAVSLAVVIAGLVVFLALDVRIAGHKWPVLLLTLLISLAIGLLWCVRRARRWHDEKTS